MMLTMASIDPENLKWPQHLYFIIPFLGIFVCIIFDLARYESEKKLNAEEKLQRHWISFLCGFLIYVVVAIPLICEFISQGKSAIHYVELLLLAIYVGIATWFITYGSFTIIGVNIFCIIMIFIGVESNEEGLLGWSTLIEEVLGKRVVWLSWLIFSLSSIGAISGIVNWFRRQAY